MRHLGALMLGALLATASLAHASEEEVQALVRDDFSRLSEAEAYSEPGTLPAKGALASGSVVYVVKGTTVYLAAKGSSNRVLAPSGEYDIGDGRVILVGREGQLLNGNLNPIENPENIRFLRKRPGRTK